MASIYEMARQRIAGATIKTPTKKVVLSECGHLVKAKKIEETEREARTDARGTRRTENQAAQVFTRMVLEAQGRMYGEKQGMGQE